MEASSWSWRCSMRAGSPTWASRSLGTGHARHAGASGHLLNRCAARADSTADVRQALEGLGYEVLATAVPRLRAATKHRTAGFLAVLEPRRRPGGPATGRERR